MRKLKLLIAVGFVACALASAQTQAGAVDLNFNNYSFNINGATTIGAIAEDAMVETEGGYLFDGNRKGDHLDFGHIGVLATGQVGPDGATASVGLRGFLADRGGSHNDGGGAALGGKLGYRIPQLNKRLGISGYLYYSPDALTFGDFKHYFEFGADVDYQIIRPAFIYVGFRRLELGLDNRGDKADQGAHIGLRINF